MISRRQFVVKSLLAGTSLMIGNFPNRRQGIEVRPRLNPGLLEPFVDHLPIPAIARPAGHRVSPMDSITNIPYYRLAMREIETRIHRDLKATRVWGFGETSPGPTIESRKNEPVIVEWANQLPSRHFLPIDHRIHGAEADKPEVRAVVHLHGGRVPADSDGYPDDWYSPGKSASYFYPNTQEATMLWYHDHAVGITRLNMFAGLFGLFFLRDDFEDALNLPRGRHEIPLVIYDRDFDTNGQLNYPIAPAPASPWISEFVGNAILVNGKLFPYLEVEPRRYRFRMLNASNGRTFHLTLANNQSFHLIGCDQGFLSAAVETASLVIAPAERLDFIVDFGERSDKQIILRNDAAPVIQFRISKTTTKDTSTLPSRLRPVVRIAESSAVKTRVLSLDEIDDQTGNPAVMLLNRTHWSMPITEKPALNTVEIWSFVNMTEDVHPIHLHMVRFQLLDRRLFDMLEFQSSRTVRYTGPAVQPDESESGWKDTVRALPNMVTRIIVPFEGYPGRYVWHCHVLEHEDNEMMRPYEIAAATERTNHQPSAGAGPPQSKD